MSFGVGRALTGRLSTTQLVHVRDEKTSGSNGGTFTSGAWRTRVLNTIMTNTVAGASLASNQITLPAGSYFVQGSAPAMMVDNHKAKIYNITASADLLIGTVETIITAAPPYVQTASRLNGVITLTATTVIELQHRCETTRAGDGFGNNSAAVGSVEVFSELILWKIA